MRAHQAEQKNTEKGKELHMFKTFLIKYGEIAIKGKNRHLFEDALVRQIRHALKKCDGTFTVYKEQGRIFVDCERGDGRTSAACFWYRRNLPGYAGRG